MSKHPSIARRHLMAAGFGPPETAAERDWLAGFLAAPALTRQVRLHQARIWMVFVALTAALGLLRGTSWWWVATLAIGVFLGAVAWQQGPSAIIRARAGLAEFDSAHPHEGAAQSQR